MLQSGWWVDERVAGHGLYNVQNCKAAPRVDMIEIKRQWRRGGQVAWIRGDREVPES